MSVPTYCWKPLGDSARLVIQRAELDRKIVILGGDIASFTGRISDLASTSGAVSSSTQVGDDKWDLKVVASRLSNFRCESIDRVAIRSGGGSGFLASREGAEKTNENKEEVSFHGEAFVWLTDFTLNDGIPDELHAISVRSLTERGSG